MTPVEPRPLGSDGADDGPSSDVGAAVGGRDLTALLAGLALERRPGEYCYVDERDVPVGALVMATVVEAEGTTAIVERGVLSDPPALALAWLTVGVASALDSVGLTAALSGALAAAGIACNVLAGRHHDHLLVPVSDAERAMSVLGALGSS